MAVLEAWSYSLPVLMTPQCNLPVGFEVEAAISVEAETDSIADGLLRLFNLTDSERLVMGQRGSKVVEDQFTGSSVATQMCEVYDWVTGHGAEPSCVIRN